MQIWVLATSLLGKSSIDVIIDFRDLMRGVDGDGGGLALFDLGEARHGVWL
jgi:hypothetical protein